MTTLVSVYNSEGLVGRCDAKCHDAAETACDCICGGRNHGVGVEQATYNTTELFEQWAAKAKSEGFTLKPWKHLGQSTLGGSTP